MAGKKFHFSLESVLKLRSHETECARQNLAAVREQIRDQEIRIADATARLDEVIQSRRTGTVGQKSLSRLEAFRQEAQNRLDEERGRLEHLRHNEEDARVELMQRKGAEEAILSLKEQEKEKFWKEYYAVETGLLDEAAIAGFRRQRRAANP